MAAYMKVFGFLTFLVIVVVSVYDVLINFEENGCRMTWMYEYPAYLKTKLSSDVEKSFPRYGLYLYGEGAYADRIKNFKLSGIPVLFIPGNAGSYRQVRSLGSVALRKAENVRGGTHFNYFSVDLNEELSGLFGGVLQEQTEFVHECLKYILTLYKKAKHPPSSVVIVGHSMGGVVARALFTLPDFNPQLVHTIITQATPHQSPVISLDYELNEFYKTVNDYWVQNANTTLSHVTVFSTGGGYRDYLVRTGLTSLNEIVPENMSVTSLSMSVPRAWVSTDHLCIVWCNELVLVTKRAMFDIIDSKTKQISSDAEFRRRVFLHHFDHNPGYSFSSPQPASVSIGEDTKWEIKDQPQWMFTRNKVKKTRHLAVPLKPEMSFVAVTTAPGDAWIVGCIVDGDSQDCSDGDNLSSHTKLVAPQKLGRRVIVLTSEILLDYTHLLIRIQPSNTKIEVAAEQFNMTERTLNYQSPGFWGTLLAYPTSLIMPEDLLPATQPGAMFYNISMGGVENIWQAIKTTLVSVECGTSDEKPLDIVEGSLLTVNVPWSKEDVASDAGSNVSANSLTLKPMVGKPTNFSSDPSVFLLLNPTCTYRVNVMPNFQETLGQIGRFCMGLIPVFMVVNILMAFGQQLYDPDSIKDFELSHGAYADNWRIVPWIPLCSYILMRDEIHWLLVAAKVPDDDLVSLTDKRIMFALMNILLYAISYVLVRVHAAGIELVFSALGVALRQGCGCNSAILNKLCSLVHSALLVGALYVALFHCGAAGIAIVMSMSIVKTIIAFTRQSPGRYLQVTVLLLLLWLLVLNGPSFIVWTQNFRFSPSLRMDPSKASAVICCGAMLVSSLLPQDIGSYGSLSSRRLLHILCLFALLYAMESVYRLPFIICTALVIFVGAQLAFAIFGAPETSAEKGKGDQDEKKTQ